MNTDSTPVRKKKKTRWLSTVLVLLLIFGGIFLFWRYRQQQTIEETIANLKTTPLVRETLQTTIGGIGNVRPKQSAILIWQTNGTVGEVHVELNQQVSNGDILLSLDENNLPIDILQANLNKINAEQALANLPTTTEIQKATLSSNIQTAREALLGLESQLLNLDSRVCEEWRLNNLQNDYDYALEEYQTFPTETKWFAVQAARSALDFCDPVVIQQQKDKVLSQIELQNSNIESWEQSLEKIEGGPDPEEQQKLELQLSLAEKQLENQYIKAPFDGSVLSVRSEIGDLVSPGTMAVEIADLNSFFIEVPVSEVDIPAIQVGQQALLSFDAFYEEQFTGTVVDIAESGDRSTGVVNYTVTIEMDNNTEKIKPGMTSGVSILTSEKPNALTVPSEAIISRDGQNYVYVLRNGEPEQVLVKTGSYSNRAIELLEADIEEGELIILNPPADIFSNFGPSRMRP